MITEEEEYSNSNITINKIAKELDIDVKVIRKIINNFFSKYGLKYYIEKGHKVKIYGLGKFVSYINGKNSITARKKKMKQFTRRRKYRALKNKQCS